MDCKRSVGVVLFHEFELLDVFGPLEMHGLLPKHFEIHLIAENRGQVQSAQGSKSVAEKAFTDEDQYNILLVPGGRGTRSQVKNSVLLDWLKRQSTSAEYVTSVCTGSVLLARAGLLDNIRATTNKMAFEWVSAQGPSVIWEKQARWVEDGKFFTSSGVSAGMDMLLALIAKLYGQKIAEQVATWAAYEWHQHSTWDPFAKLHGLVH